MWCGCFRFSLCVRGFVWPGYISWGGSRRWLSTSPNVRKTTHLPEQFESFIVKPVAYLTQTIGSILINVDWMKVVIKYIVKSRSRFWQGIRAIPVYIQLYHGAEGLD